MSISHEINQLKELFAQNTSLIDQKLVSLDSIAHRVDLWKGRDGYKNESFDLIRYQLNDLLGKLESRFEDLQSKRNSHKTDNLADIDDSRNEETKFNNRNYPRNEEIGTKYTNKKYPSEDGGSRLSTRKTSVGNSSGFDEMQSRNLVRKFSGRSTMDRIEGYTSSDKPHGGNYIGDKFERSSQARENYVGEEFDRNSRHYNGLSGIEELVEDLFEGLFERERNKTLDDAYDSLTSIQGSGNVGSPNDAIVQLQVYFNSITNIIKPELKEDFGSLLKSTGNLTECVPYNDRNVRGLNELVQLVENMIGAFTE